MPTDGVPIGLAPESVEVQQNEFTTTQVEQVLKAQKEVLDEMNSKKMIMLLEWLLELVK